MSVIIRSIGTIYYPLLYLNSGQGFDGLKHLYIVISVIVDSLPANTKNRESTRSWTARVRLVHSWADRWVRFTVHSAQSEASAPRIQVAPRAHVSGIYRVHYEHESNEVEARLEHICHV